jgi:hypothetical protein
MKVKDKMAMLLSWQHHACLLVWPVQSLSGMSTGCRRGFLRASVSIACALACVTISAATEKIVRQHLGTMNVVILSGTFTDGSIKIAKV